VVELVGVEVGVVGVEVGVVGVVISPLVPLIGSVWPPFYPTLITGSKVQV
jgi:hypothetical protein